MPDTQKDGASARREHGRKQRGSAKPIGAWKRLLVNPASRERLASDIGEIRGRLESLRRSRESEPWVGACEFRLQQADVHLQTGHVDIGFERLQSAFRELVSGLEPEQRTALAVSVKHEAERKLADSWRGQAVAELLKGPPEKVGVRELQEALWHRDTNAQNGYRKIALQQSQLHVLGALLLGLLVLVMVSAGLGAFQEIDSRSRLLVPSSIVFGLMGGTLSAAISVTRVGKDARIPDIQRSRWILFTRGLLGAAAALATYLLIRGSLIALPQSRDPTWSLLFFSFLAGFSERWFLSTISRQEGKGDSKR